MASVTRKIILEERIAYQLDPKTTKDFQIGLHCGHCRRFFYFMFSNVENHEIKRRGNPKYAAYICHSCQADYPKLQEAVKKSKNFKEPKKPKKRQKKKRRRSSYRSDGL